MYKISWGRKNDKFYQTFLVVQDVHTLFEIYHVITGYGRDDGCVPVNVLVTNLDGFEVDMSKGLAAVASCGTYSSKR